MTRHPLLLAGLSTRFSHTHLCESASERWALGNTTAEALVGPAVQPVRRGTAVGDCRFSLSLRDGAASVLYPFGL